jgi:hypothetical protein
MTASNSPTDSNSGCRDDKVLLPPLKAAVALFEETGTASAPKGAITTHDLLAGHKGSTTWDGRLSPPSPVRMYAAKSVM